MEAVCPACGKTSRDIEFCDFCNADMRGPPPTPTVPLDCPVGNAVVTLKPEQAAHLVHPEAALLVRTDDGWRRVHWLPRAAYPRWLSSIRERMQLALACLPPAVLVERDDGAWLVVETTARFASAWDPPSDDPYEETARLLAFLERLVAALEELHHHGFVWLTFALRHLEETDSGNLRFANLDLAVYRHGECPERLHLKHAFAPPEVLKFVPADIGPRTDVYHLGLLSYYWLARLMPDGFPGGGLEAFGHKLPPLRLYAPSLPPGLAAVISAACALEPARRFATPRDFANALRHTFDRSVARRQQEGACRWEIGAHTRTGKAKEALGRSNEDHVLTCPFQNPERALLAVADGITTCDVGSGALASVISTMVVENACDSRTTKETFPQRIREACQSSARTLLDWALEKGYRQQLLDGADLMGTTLLAAWLEGRSLTLANLGDSRAYLIDEYGIEQLTVDGDLGTSLLASGTPPEDIRSLGLVAKSLRECIGGCTVTPEGELSILEESCRPHVTRWHLLPGDIIILCSDGLVEEDAFIEPEVLLELVRARGSMSAADLALYLVDYADHLQRLPTALEPDGFGDNISCIVIKVT